MNLYEVLYLDLYLGNQEIYQPLPSICIKFVVLVAFMNIKILWG